MSRFVWSDTGLLKSRVISNKNSILMEVEFSEPRDWRITILGQSVIRKGSLADMESAKVAAEGMLLEFMNKYGFHLDATKFPGTAHNFRTGRSGLVWEIRYMMVLLRRVIKLLLPGKMNTRNSDGSFTVTVPRKLADSIYNYLVVKDADFKGRKDIQRIVTLGRQDKIKNVDWRDLLEQIKEYDERRE